MPVLRRLVQVCSAVDRDQWHTQALGLIGCGFFGEVPDPRGETPLKLGHLFRRDEIPASHPRKRSATPITQQRLHTQPVRAAGHVEVDKAVGTGEKRCRPLLIEIAAVDIGRDLAGDESAQDAVGAGN